jgi:hypothetical protein
VYSGSALTGFATNGSQMGGMRVTWTAVTGAVSSASWANLGDGFWGVNSDGFRVQYDESTTTFGYRWGVSNGSALAIRSIRFNGAPGRTLFDCAWTGTACSGPGSSIPEGTSGSAEGWTFENGETRSGVSATYSNLFKLDAAAAPVGDLFEQLTITFGGDGLGAQEQYSFFADTDNSPSEAPEPTPVPEPSSAVLMVAGLAGLAGARRFRRA